MACRSLAFFLCIACSGAASAAAGADGFEDMAKLESRVVAALDVDVGQPGGPVAHIDKRLKLAACPAPVTIDPPALGALPLRCEPLGWRLRVPLVRVAAAQSTPGFAPAAAQAPPIIKRGDPVQLVSGADGFSVSMAGTAQEDGRAGGRLRVKTEVSGPVVIGQVVDAGIVRVGTY
ncbi:flagella basal body P-ring formation protein FlgA [Sphingomonas sp.]|uniref:flagella basal body P-ring formation protein FlgA n=1 Tax=Sphingomonas sp. TaxID=28214 RepID=UPI003AFFA70F